MYCKGNTPRVFKNYLTKIKILKIMKKVFFTLALILVASFGFASTQLENVVTDKIVDEYMELAL